MRRKTWSERELPSSERDTAPAGAPSPSADRMAALLAMIDGGEGSGTPCSVGVPPWFLAAAHDRLAEMTRGTGHEGKVEAVFGEGAAAGAAMAPDKVALALAAIDETFRAEIAAIGAAKGQ